MMEMALGHGDGGPFPPAAVRARIDALERDFRILAPTELGRRVNALHRLARTAGLEPAATLAAGLADAVARHGRGAMIMPYLAGLREAACCEPSDSRAGDILLATIGVRLAG
ncbi:hypothetical protein CLG96_11275 [Sphingomonas oleivorans]|uniref:Uncharacterized protein n=1 Tax=Sphingomonas oleivorans TaxID=1735121 RepID=A0A2T5FXS8_9SPHN|nr:hypothetical protein [Sphingomonas oleivorans]PTQ10950.1 hypothetical protein CLG96_11275 [Sphingomonas oleivorans]